MAVSGCENGWADDGLMMGSKSEGPRWRWAGAVPRIGHCGHGHIALLRVVGAIATSGFGHSTFLHYILLTQT